MHEAAAADAADIDFCHHYQQQMKIVL